MATDHRVRLSYLSGQTTTYTGILQPLAATNGLLFPYTPQISFSQSIDYATLAMTHANQSYHAYSKTANPRISLSGKFAIQNKTDGEYALAAIHFLRTNSKMYFGENDRNAGVPPPVMSLDGYGTYMFNKLRVILIDFSHSFNENDQMVSISTGNGNVMLPAVFMLTCSLIVQNTARAQRQDFTLDKFRSGELMSSAPNDSGWI